MIEKKQEIFEILNGLVFDLISATRTYDFLLGSPLEKRFIPAVKTGIFRMIFSHIVLTLCKFLEFYEKYHTNIPSNKKLICKSLKKLIEKKGIRQFRNQCVGHIWDKKEKKPLTLEEQQKRTNAIIENDWETFSAWINNPKGNSYPNTVVGILEDLRTEFEVKNNNPG
jgi:hypothetical protein